MAHRRTPNRTLLFQRRMTARDVVNERFIISPEALEYFRRFRQHQMIPFEDRSGTSWSFMYLHTELYNTTGDYLTNGWLDFVEAYDLQMSDIARFEVDTHAVIESSGTRPTRTETRHYVSIFRDVGSPPGRRIEITGYDSLSTAPAVEGPSHQEGGSPGGSSVDSSEVPGEQIRDPQRAQLEGTTEGLAVPQTALRTEGETGPET